MKLSGFVLLAVLSFALAFPAWAQNPRLAGVPAGGSEVTLGFQGGSTWTSMSNTEGTGICIWYFPVVGDFDVASLFETGSAGTPVVDRAHSYLIWVSDFSAQFLPSPYFLALAPAGQGTIYFSDRPDTRDWSDLTKRSTWGVPVATFIRKASLVRSGDNLITDTFVFSSELVSSKSFTLNGKHFNFKDLVPHGMTCFEYGQNGSSWEAGSCVSIGAAVPSFF